jgi:hypothetical protein
MTGKCGTNVPNTSFSEGTTRRTGDRPAERLGCRYVTPGGRCGEAGTRHSVNGVRVVLCEPHLEAALVENGLAGSAG